ncbi:endolytic transglycosylase MltG [Pseudactinotalea terrae]|uniref:endolytic transglycosylase MltG n=1 Tax=Pseudactinotalea terrae TaxID=1743262 RepID=UPI0012E26DCB|nr:endolytic transglycosylase MltG [Pseudactinotalea terrae]
MAGVQPLNEDSSQTDTSGSEGRRHSRVRDRRRRNLTVLVVLVIALVLLIGGAWRLVLPLFEEPGAEPVTDYPGPGSGVVSVVIDDPDPQAIAGVLVESDVVATADAFVDAYANNEAASGIGAGTYTLAQQMRASDAVVALLDPANRADRTLTIPPGWRQGQIIAKVAEVMGVPVADVEAALAQVTLPEGADGGPEGWLYAEAYSIGPEEPLLQVLQRMIDRTVEVLDEYGVAPADRESTLIRASIVEAEVKDPEDRGRVARVLTNRLAGCSDVGPLLQMNSTVAYGLDKAVTDLTLDDLSDDSTPYNTYVFEGLPPAPINSPSTASIEAVLAPPEGSWCYFVTVNLETGETLFTDDPAEHEENRARYREWLEGWREEQSAAADEPTESEG